jgi:hypothetical protein
VDKNTMTQYRDTYTHSSKHNSKVIFMVIDYSLFELYKTSLTANLSSNLTVEKQNARMTLQKGVQVTIWHYQCNLVES